jgi:hypothetical protein
MELLGGEDLRRHLLGRYSRNPRGWTFIISPPGKHGFYDAIVSGPDETWKLKMDSLFKPLPIVLGSLAEANPELRPLSPVPYGFRELPPRSLLEMLGGVRSGKVDSPSRVAMANFLSVLRSETVVPEQGRSYAEGPFVFTGRREVGLSESEKALDEKLTSEMHQLLRTRYPAYQ